MTVCSTCKHANYCEIVAGGYSSQVKSCRDYRKGETTNEEWFCSLSTEEKVKALLDLRERIRQKMRAELGSENKFHNGDYYREWLKEKHHDSVQG